MNSNVVLQWPHPSCWLHFCNPLEVITTTDPTQVYPLLSHIEQQVNQHNFYAVGFITYEAAPAFDPVYRVQTPGVLPLLWFGLYRQPLPGLPTTSKADTYTLSDWQPTIDQATYETALAKIKSYIKRGETYQVNYTMRLRANFWGSPWGLFSKLIENQRGEYAAYIDTGSTAICSVSPELFFRRDGATIISKPMKGTAARGLTLAQDQQQSNWLQNSEKNRAENVMIVDMIRNDLGRVAQAGSVQVPQLFEVEQYPTILQMTSTVTAKTQASTADIMAALFPCASITGAPKVRTMEIIRELETEPRGIYTGCIGYLAPNQQAQFNVAIRTVAIDKQRGVAEYGVGGGIVWDSDSGSEYQECQIKARVLTEARPRFDLLETILWEPQSGYFLLPEHLHRLVESARYFNIPINYEQLIDRLATLVEPFNQPHRVRLLVAPDGQFTTQAIPFDLTPSRRLWRVAIAATPVDSNNPFLYHKTTNRQVYTKARQARPGFDDVILWNEHGQITEATIANVVIKRGDDLITPPVECGLLAGTYRAHLLAQNEIREQIITVDELKQSEQIYLINSVRRWVEVEVGG